MVAQSAGTLRGGASVPVTGRRVDIRAILADAGRRRDLMVGALWALQNREGILTTLEQAEEAYDRVLHRTREGLVEGSGTSRRPC